MPTYEALARFRQDYKRLTKEQQDAFNIAVAKFVGDLKRGRLRAGLRIKPVRIAPGVYEMTWAPDGRATFEYGTPLYGEEPHIIWRRIGSHTILSEP